MNNPSAFEARLDLVPTSPGVYLMKNNQGSVIYVGKAINLRQRLRSYFGTQPKGNRKVQAMIRQIHDFSYLLAENELEALVLESNLIKRYQPFYNILLKDDHDYPYLKITMHEAYPRAMKAYRIGSDIQEGAKYYGPYLAGDLYRALKTLHDIFPIKTCKRVFPRDIGKERPCLNYHIHRCVAPCSGDVSAESYRAIMQSVCDFLEGRYKGITAQLEADMKAAAARQAYEQAAVIRDRLQALTKLKHQQIAVNDVHLDADAIGMAARGLEVCVLKLEIRSGKINGTSTFFLQTEGQPFEEVLDAFFTQHYSQSPYVARHILLPSLLNETRDGMSEEAEDPSVERWEKMLSHLANHKVALSFPQRGLKRKLVDMAMKNATEAVRRRDLMKGSGEAGTTQALMMLKQFCRLPGIPMRIEAYDISNFGDKDQACGMVVFEKGRAKKSDYRRFKIRYQDQQNDYGAMLEAIRRRLDALSDLRFGQRPDLILVDGGLNHVGVVLQLLEEKNCGDIAVAGLVKDGRHRTRGLALPDGKIVEVAKVLGLARGQFAQGQDMPAEMEQYDRAELFAFLRLLTAIQDEAHRYVGQYTQLLTKKRSLRYRLESIPGIGPAYRKKLLAAFKTIKAVQMASVAELLAHVPDLGQRRAEAIYRYFRPD